MKQEIEAFLDNLTMESEFSENTVAAYKNDLVQLADFLQEKGVSKWAEVDRQLILSYFLDLKERGYALTTVARKTASAKSLFKFMVKTGIIRKEPTENIASPRVKKGVPRPLTVTQVRELLKQPEKYPTPEAKRDKAMLELLYATGMQIRELMLLNCDDADIRQGSISYTVKGSKTRKESINLDSVPSLQRYLEEARPQLARNKDENALFLNRLGERLTRQGFWQIVKGYAEEAKLDDLVTLRALRHSFTAHAPKP